MLTTLRVANYRSLTNLRIDALNRVNLISGRNNSGKTTLLESLLILSTGHPEVTLHDSIIRGITSENLPSNAVPSILWKQIFPSHDMDTRIEIDADHQSMDHLGIEIELEHDEIVRRSVSGSTDARLDDESPHTTLLVRTTRGSEEWERRMRVTDKEIQIERRNQPVLFPAFIVPAGRGELKSDAACLDYVKRTKQGHRVVDALRIVDTSLASLEVISETGEPMIWADVGLPQLVPLPTVGEGMLRICRFAMGLVIARGGVLLVDEIENGIHHSIVAKVWQFIMDAAVEMDVQVFVTTHSYECVQAAQSLNSDQLMLHRLEATEAGHRCVTIPPQELETAVLHSLEIR